MESGKEAMPTLRSLEAVSLSLERSLAARTKDVAQTLTVMSGTGGKRENIVGKIDERSGADDIDVLRKLVVVPWAKKGKQVKFNMNSNTVELTHPADEYERCELIDDEQMMESAKMWYLHEQDIEAKRQENVKQAEKAKCVEQDLIAKLHKYTAEVASKQCEPSSVTASSSEQQMHRGVDGMPPNNATGIGVLMERIIQMEAQLAQAQERVQQLERTSSTPMSNSSEPSTTVPRALPDGQGESSLDIATSATDNTERRKDPAAAQRGTPTKIPVRVLVSPAAAATTAQPRAVHTRSTSRPLASPSPSAGTPRLTRRSSADHYTELDWDEGHLAHVSFSEETRPRTTTGPEGGAADAHGRDSTMVPPPLPPRQYAHMLREVQNLSGLRTPADTPPSPAPDTASKATQKSGSLFRFFKRGKKTRSEREPREQPGRSTSAWGPDNNGNAEDTCNLKSKNASKQASKQAARANRDAARRQKAEIKMLRKHAPDMLHEELHARASDRARVPNRPDSAACSDGPSGGLGRTLSRKSSPLVAVSSASTGTEAVSERASDDNTVPNDVHATGKTPSLLRRWSFSHVFGRRARAAVPVSPGGTTRGQQTVSTSPADPSRTPTRRRRHSVGGDLFARFKRSAKASVSRKSPERAAGLCYDDSDELSQSYHDHGPLKGTVEFADRPCVLSDLLTASKSLSTLAPVSGARSVTSKGGKAYTSSTPNRTYAGRRTMHAGGKGHSQHFELTSRGVGGSKIPTPRSPFKTLNQSYETAV
eukprot:m.35247 g.35247  ORF g.35247 m.35247 type:complete len:764 (-) comp14393_c0_seq5:203-2494(-)